MNCEFNHELLSKYTDRELNSDRISSVESHLAECEGCRVALRSMRRLGGALERLPRENVPDGLILRILADAGREARRSALDSVKLTFSAIFLTAVHGFRIEDDRAELLRRDLPAWVSRWVLFV